MELNVFLIVMCMSHPPARVGVNYIYISYINIGHTVASNKYLLSCWWSEVTAGCTTASMVMWPTAETCDITLLSSPSRLWLTWCLELEAIFIFSNSKFLCGNLCNICLLFQHWFKSECFHKYSITIVTNTNHKKVPLLWKKWNLFKSHGSTLSYTLVAESMPFFTYMILTSRVSGLTVQKQQTI